jgi:hypothetical protein
MTGPDRERGQLELKHDTDSRSPHQKSHLDLQVVALPRYQLLLRSTTSLDVLHDNYTQRDPSQMRKPSLGACNPTARREKRPSYCTAGHIDLGRDA